MQPWQNPELEAVRKEHLEFARDELDGDFARRDREGDFSRDRWQKAAAHGVLGIPMPREYGGQGRPLSHLVAAFEGLGEGCHDGGFVYALCSQVLGIQMALRLAGSDFLKKKYLPRLISGEISSAHAFTEKSSGSDAFSMQTFAEKTADGFVLRGSKCFVTNAPHADVAMVFARTSKERNPFALSVFMVDMDGKGASHGESFEKLGMRTVHMGELLFQDVAVPEDHCVGGVGAGLRVLAESTGYERALLLTTALGTMRRAIDECSRRSKTRVQFDKPIGSFQGVSSRVANMVMRYETSRTVLYDMAARLGDGKSMTRFIKEAAIVKLFVSQGFVQTELDALQIFGVRGYLLQSFAQQDLRDALSSSIWAGTDETLRNTIAKLAGVPVG